MDRREETKSALSTPQGGLSNLAAKKMETEQCSDMSPEEEELIHKLHSLLGDRWKLIAGRLPGRRAEEVERYWRMMEKRKSEKHNLYRPICVRLTPSFKFDMADQFEEPEESRT